MPCSVGDEKDHMIIYIERWSQIICAVAAGGKEVCQLSNHVCASCFNMASLCGPHLHLSLSDELATRYSAESAEPARSYVDISSVRVTIRFILRKNDMYLLACMSFSVREAPIVCLSVFFFQ